jgi:tetratricopeptide (TPR) repeat protein
MKLWKEAEAELAAIKKLRPDDPDVGIAAFRAFAANGYSERAAEEYQTAVNQHPENFSVLLERFRFHEERGEAQEAAKAFAEVASVGGDDQLFHIRLADACAALGQWSKARDEYLRTLDLELLGDGELTRTAWFRLALLQLYFKDVDGYRHTCSQLFERHASNADWRTRIVLVRISQLHPDPGVKPEGVAELLSQMKGAGDPAKGLHDVAIISLKLGKDDVEPQALEAAWNKYHVEPQRIAQARVVYARGDYARARSLMDLVPSENRVVDPAAGTSRNWDINLETQLWYTQAETVIQSAKWRAVDELMKKHQWTAAIDALGPLLEPGDRSPQDWGARATCFCELGRWNDALADSAKAVALNSEWVTGLQMHSLVAMQTGDFETYRKLCRQALQRNASSSNSERLNNVGWLCALDPSAAEEAEGALKLLEQSLRLAPRNTHAHTRACLLYRVGRYEDALKELSELIAQPGYPVNAYDWLFLAMTEEKLGQSQSARANLERSVAWITSNNRLDWQHRLELERFRAEAEALIGAQK